MSGSGGSAIRVADREVLISAISTWEVAMLVHKGRLRLTIDNRDWIRRTEALPFIRVVPVDNTIRSPGR